MKRTTYQKVAIVHSSDPMEFEEQYNERSKAISGDYKIISQNVSAENHSYTGVIIYEVVEAQIDSVADEFHAEGVHYLCKHCPYLDDPKDKRIKRCTCKYAELGVTHKDHEACEVFYRALKAGTVSPLDEYMR